MKDSRYQQIFIHNETLLFYNIIMSKTFNLLLLHTYTDIHPRTWICLRGKKLEYLVKTLEKNVLIKNNLSRNALSKIIASKYRCSTNTVGRILQGNTKYYPLPILLEMLKLTGNPKKIIKEINKKTEYLKVNSASAKPVKAIRVLNENLAKIIGAFMADGSLSVQIVIASHNRTELDSIKIDIENYKINYSLGRAMSRNQFYISIQVNQNNIHNIHNIISQRRKNIRIQTHFGIELTDAYRDNVEVFKNWLRKEFNIKPNRFDRKKDAWRVAFSNKILSRYFTKFFEIIPGLKTYTAFEPEVIRSSDLSIRKAFAKGVLMFDGCVSKNSKILFSTVSNKLFESIKEIWENDHIKFGSSLNNRRDRIEFSLFTTQNNKEKKLLAYFENGTQKEKLLKWLGGDLNSKPIIIPRHSSLISTQNILKVLDRIKKCDSEFIKQQFNCTHTTARTYMKILKNQNKIKLTNKPDGINNYVSKNTMTFLEEKFHKLIFKKIKDQFYINKNFAKFIGIHKATFSAWKTRKNRIPLYQLKEICSILYLDYNEALKNVIGTDREIAEII